MSKYYTQDYEDQFNQTLAQLGAATTTLAGATADGTSIVAVGGKISAVQTPLSATAAIANVVDTTLLGGSADAGATFGRMTAAQLKAYLGSGAAPISGTFSGTPTSGTAGTALTGGTYAISNGPASGTVAYIGLYNTGTSSYVSGTLQALTTASGSVPSFTPPSAGSYVVALATQASGGGSFATSPAITVAAAASGGPTILHTMSNPSSGPFSLGGGAYTTMTGSSGPLFWSVPWQGGSPPATLPSIVMGKSNTTIPVDGVDFNHDANDIQATQLYGNGPYYDPATNWYQYKHGETANFSRYYWLKPNDGSGIWYVCDTACNFAL